MIKQIKGAEHRKKVAHSVSCGTSVNNELSPGGAKETWPIRSQIS